MTEEEYYERLEALTGNWKKMSKYRLAKEAGLSYSTLKNIIERKSSPRLYTMTKIAGAFDMSLAEFIGGSDADWKYTKEDDILIEVYHNATLSQRQEILSYSRYLIENNKKE